MSMRVRLANDSRYGLTASVWTKNLDTGQAVALRLEAGSVCVNDCLVNFAVTDLHLHDGEPLKFTAEFEILPEIPTAGYENVKVEHSQVTVADEEIEETVNGLREQRSTYDPIEDRAAERQHHSQVNGSL